VEKTVGQSFLCIGHRGARGHEPENTILSVEKAIRLGASWVEVDVQFVDGHLMVFHDDRLERTTDGTGLIREKTWDYLRSLDAGKGQRIPTLKEIFTTLKGRAGLNIELKGSHTSEPVTRSIQEQLLQGWRYEDILVSSFDHHRLLNVKRLDPQVQTGALITAISADTAAFAQTLGCYSIHPSIEIVHKGFVDDAHHRGLKVFVYTVNEIEDMARMQFMGVDGVFTDYPERCI
jgi:glycerophosphoryl diester phosphodiesterase